MVSPLDDTPWLAWMEKLMGSSGGAPATELPPSLFYCHLEKQPDHLVPQHALLTKPCGDDGLCLNPECWFTDGDDLPAGLNANESVTEKLALRGPMAWVPHAATGRLQPYWLSTQLREKLENWRAGEGSSSDISADALESLAMAGVVTHRDADEAERERWKKSLAKAAEEFHERGYVPLAGLIHPFHVAALRRYYRHRVRTGGMVLGDGQSSRRYVAHNDGVARFFHDQLKAAMSVVAGEAVKSSYVYVASYQGGAKLDVHTDRLQCEFSITFCLDYAPEPQLATPWPLLLHTKSGTVTVYQAIGDALLYRGRVLPHSRDRLRQGQTATSIFFHYVREGFSGPLD
jgi:hypothetical protein